MDRQWDRFLKLIVREALILSATAALWMLTLRFGGNGGWWSTLLSIVTGLITVFVGYLVHEWGHLLGAWIAGSAFELPATPMASIFLFRFDSGRSSREQFLSMSMGGFIASILVVALLLIALPKGMLASQLALGFTGLGVLATFILEIPGCWRVWRGAPLPTGAAFVSGTDPQHGHAKI